MNIRENIMAVLHRKKPEYIPFAPYRSIARISPSAEERLRKMGMGILYAWIPVYKVEYPNVHVEERLVGNILYRIYRTPVGSMSMRIRTGLRPEAGGNWIIEYPFKESSDYKIIRFVEEDAVYKPDYEYFVELDRKIGDSGILTANADPTPFSKLWVQYMGLEKLCKEFYRNREKIEDLIHVMAMRQEEAYRIIADSPAEFVWCGDQITSLVMSPKIFEKYYIPLLERYARILHSKNKMLSVHMDGLLKRLKDSIATMSIDIVEAFTPPPMGDLPIKEAKESWNDKFIIWINFPETILHHGVKVIEEYTIKLLKEMAPGDGFVIGMTEDAPVELLEDAFTVIIKTLKSYGRYPIKN
jgi:uroporphyrinogen-III decarboxylase